MADGISFKILTEPFHKFIDEKNARMPKAAQWAVREAGRVAKTSAKKAAPVMKDKTVLNVSQRRHLVADVKYHGHVKAGRVSLGQVTASTKGPVRGLLKASIAPSKRLTQLGDSAFSLKVGPRGPHVHLYAQKIEARKPYMAVGEAAALAAMEGIAEDAFGRVWQ